MTNGQATSFMSDILHLVCVCNSHRTTNLVTTGTRNGLQRDWSSLPPELLNLIAENLNEIFDLVRFRSVCTAWRSSTSITDLPPQFPWILEGCKDWHQTDLWFYSVYFNKIYTIHAPKSLEKRFFKLSEEYFFVYPLPNSRDVRAHQMRLLNLLNNYEIPLPSFEFGRGPSSLGHQKNEKGEHVICYGIDGMNSKSLYFYCRLGHENWRKLQIDSDFYNCAHFFLKSMIFNVDNLTGITKVVDTTTGELTYVIPAVDGHLVGGRVYLVEAYDDILRVLKHGNRSSDFDYFKLSFDVHRLVVSESGSPYWVKVENISGHALFIDWNGAFTIKANDLAGIRANCIYLLKRVYERISKRHLCVVERIEIETGAREQFSCPLKNPKGWFIPNLNRF